MLVQTYIEIDELLTLFGFSKESDVTITIQKNKYFASIAKKIDNRHTLKTILNDSSLIGIIKRDPTLIFPIYFNKVGDYDIALDSLKIILVTHEINNDIIYCFADTLHLLNFYQEALNILEIINGCVELKDEYLLLKGHILKHLGQFNEAIQVFEIAQNNKAREYHFKRKIVSTLYLKYLSEALENSINSVLFEELTKEIDSMPTNHQTDIYKAAIHAYSNPVNSLKIIDACIEALKNGDDRYIYNAYYIKAEILRRLNRFDEAYDYYGMASGIYDNHIDINLIDQCYFSAKYLEIRMFVNGLLSKQLIDKRKMVIQKRLLVKTKIESIIGTIQKQSIQIDFDNLNLLRFNNQLISFINLCQMEKDYQKLDEIMIKNTFIIL